MMYWVLEREVVRALERPCNSNALEGLSSTEVTDAASGAAPPFVTAA